MFRNWLSCINYSIAAIAGLLLVLAIIFSFTRDSAIDISDQVIKKRTLPPCSFAHSKTAYDLIGKSPCDLKFTPQSMQLPDLKNHLIYYGRNGRPDAELERPVLHFSFLGNPSPTPIMSGERLYLYYDRTKSPAQYVFSPGNQETPLWITASAQGNDAIVQVSMKNEFGEIIREPNAYAQIRLSEKENVRPGVKSWEIGKLRVDGSLLARQKARWMGVDRFLERHGGDEFKHLQEKHRIDFTDEENPYSVYVGLNDTLIWDNKRWKTVEPDDNTLDYPLMVVKKIEDRVMNFELWDVGGKNKVSLNLIKSSEAWMPQNLQDAFKFLGARTHSQYIFEVDNQRILISPQDWLLLNDEKWMKLTTSQEIDDYVERKLIGILFVIDGATKKEGRQVLTGVMFNASRTEMQEIEISIQQNGSQNLSQEDPKEKDKNDDDEDDDDDLDEDDDVTRPHLPHHGQGPIQQKG